MKIAMIVLALCLSLASALADESGIDQTPSPFVRIGAESGGAIVCGGGAGILGALGLYAVFHGTGDVVEGTDAARLSAVVLSYISFLPAGSALGAWGAGSLMHENRPFWPALLGSAGGVVAGAGVFFMSAESYEHGNYTGWVVAACLPPVGAVIGYNLGRPRDAEYGWLEQHLDMPRMAMTVTHDEFMHPVAGVKCDLLSARF